jgi:hypothetical protein
MTGATRDSERDRAPTEKIATKAGERLPERRFYTSPEAIAFLDQMYELMDREFKGGEDVSNIGYSMKAGEYIKAGGDPAKLLAFVDQYASLTDQGEIPFAMGWCLASVATVDGPAAAKWIESAKGKYGFDLGFPIQVVASSWLSNDPSAATPWLEDNLEELSDSAVISVLTDWDPADVGGAVEWIERQIESENPKIGSFAVSSISHIYASQDPEAAVAWVDTLPEEMKANAYGGVIYGWPREDRQSAIDWVKSHDGGGEVYDRARKNLIFTIFQDVGLSAVTVEIASAITDPSWREHELVKAGKYYCERFPEFAREWLPNSGISKEIREKILSAE